MFGRPARIETKTPEQILRMRRAGLVVGQTLQLMAQTVRAGITTKQLDELAEEHIRGREAARPEDLALIDATEDAMWAGIAALGAGESLYAVGAAVEDSVTEASERDQHDYGIVEDYVGHGIGTEMHQDPQVPNYRVREKGPTVRPGVTVAIEPMVTLGSSETRILPDDWTVVTADGSRAAHWENSVAVTDEGLWVLTALDGGQARLEAAGAAYAPLA